MATGVVVNVFNFVYPWLISFLTIWAIYELIQGIAGLRGREMGHPRGFLGELGVDRKGERKEEKRAQRDLSEGMRQVTPGLEFMQSQTPLAEIRRVKKALSDPLLFIEEVMTKGNVFGYQQYARFVNHMQEVIQKDRDALERLNKKALEQLERDVTGIYSVRPEVFDERHWGDVHSRILNIFNLSSTQGFNWSHKGLKKTFEKEEDVNFLRDELRKQDIWENDCKALIRASQMMIYAIQAYEELRHTKVE